MKTNRDIRKRYRDHLNDIRWMRFRDEIIEAAGGVCWACGETESLEVHHLVYRDVLPWEYDDGEVRVLCERCHKAVHVVADLVWVATLRFEPHELELLLKRLRETKAPGAFDEVLPDRELNIDEIMREIYGTPLP